MPVGSMKAIVHGGARGTTKLKRAAAATPPEAMAYAGFRRTSAINSAIRGSWMPTAMVQGANIICWTCLNTGPKKRRVRVAIVSD